MCWAIKLVKQSSIFLIIILLASSIVQVAYSSYYLVLLHLTVKPLTLAHPLIIFPPLTLLLCGIVSLFLFCLGCTGLIKEVRGCVYLYSSVLLTLAVVHLALSCFVMWYYFHAGTRDLDRQVVKDLEITFKDEKSRYFVDNTQKLLKCCGLDNREYWPSDVLHKSCCLTSRDCRKNSTDVYHHGCSENMVYFINSNNLIMAYASVPFGFLEFNAALLAICWGYLDSQYSTSYKV